MWGDNEDAECYETCPGANSVGVGCGSARKLLPWGGLVGSPGRHPDPEAVLARDTSETTESANILSTACV
jgi:hypothetical protein